MFYLKITLFIKIKTKIFRIFLKQKFSLSFNQLKHLKMYAQNRQILSETHKFPSTQKNYKMHVWIPILSYNFSTHATLSPRLKSCFKAPKPSLESETVPSSPCLNISLFIFYSFTLLVFSDFFINYNKKNRRELFVKIVENLCFYINNYDGNISLTDFKNNKTLN